MKINKRFTFKTECSTGKYRSFYPDSHYIKLNKIVCGKIEDKLPYTIRLQVIKTNINEDGNPNCAWRWVTFKKEFNTLKDAKEWLNRNFEEINKSFKIKATDD